METVAAVAQIGNVEAQCSTFILSRDVFVGRPVSSVPSCCVLALILVLHPRRWFRTWQLEVLKFCRRLHKLELRVESGDVPGESKWTN